MHSSLYMLFIPGWLYIARITSTLSFLRLYFYKLREVVKRFFLKTLWFIYRRYSRLIDSKLSNYQLLKLYPKLLSTTVCVTIAIISRSFRSRAFLGGKMKRFGWLKDNAYFLRDKHYKILARYIGCAENSITICYD